MHIANQIFPKFNPNQQQVRTAPEPKINEVQILDNKTICFVYPNGDVVVHKVSEKSEYAV